MLFAEICIRNIILLGKTCQLIGLPKSSDVRLIPDLF